MTERIRIELHQAPIELPVRAASSTDGAACTFRGTTRAEMHAEYGALEALDYEVHEAMAMAQLRSLAAEVVEEFGLGSLYIIHATGRVPVGQASVLIEATGGHRDEAFLGCRAAIDRLKQRVPIFKIECWARGTSRPEGVTPRPEPINSDPQGG
jgi:molybdopterin synthase catalytic subunit